MESPLPANSGGRIGVYKRLEQISKTEKIYLFYPYDNKSDLAFTEELKKYCVEVYPYERKKNRENAIRRIAKYPYTVSSREFEQMKTDICECIKNNSIDLINVDFPHMCVNLLHLNLNIPIILNEHNVEWEVYRNISRSETNLLKKLLYWIDSYRLKAYEYSLKSHIVFSKVSFVSCEDRRFMISNGLYDERQTALIPVGADLITDFSCDEHTDIRILFVGKMSYGPNVEAVKWFVEEIFPIILKSIPNATFYIVGKDPTKEVIRLKNERIVVTGMVDSVKNYYNNADLVVLPLRYGGGVKVKLLEAISYKKKIVSTSTGVEGTIYTNGESIPVCDKADGFAEACINSINGEYTKRYDLMYNLFLNTYTWDQIGQDYLQLFKDVI